MPKKETAKSRAASWKVEEKSFLLLMLFLELASTTTSPQYTIILAYNAPFGCCVQSGHDTLLTHPTTPHPTTSHPPYEQQGRALCQPRNLLQH